MKRITHTTHKLSENKEFLYHDTKILESGETHHILFRGTAYDIDARVKTLAQEGFRPILKKAYGDYWILYFEKRL